jgi:hypothetical protein
MTIPVQIQFGNHVLNAQLHALPRVGDGIICCFPASISDEKLGLIVTGVGHLQIGHVFDGRKDPEPFFISITTDLDPALQQNNEAVMNKAAGLSGA